MPAFIDQKEASYLPPRASICFLFRTFERLNAYTKFKA